MRAPARSSSLREVNVQDDLDLDHARPGVLALYLQLADAGKALKPLHLSEERVDVGKVALEIHLHGKLEVSIPAARQAGRIPPVAQCQLLADAGDLAYELAEV